MNGECFIFCCIKNIAMHGEGEWYTYVMCSIPSISLASWCEHSDEYCGAGDTDSHYPHPGCLGLQVWPVRVESYAPSHSLKVQSFPNLVHLQCIIIALIITF